jgi:hypothetical protein
MEAHRPKKRNRQIIERKRDPAVLERNNFNRIKTTGRFKISPNSGLRDAASEDRYDHHQQRQNRSGGINYFLIMMTPGFLAGAGTVNAENALQSLIPSGSTVSQTLIYFGALFLVGLGFFAWAIIFRRQRLRGRSHHSSKPRSRHHRQSGDRPRHRTLADAGGLPPVRTEKQPPSPA